MVISRVRFFVTNKVCVCGGGGGGGGRRGAGEGAVPHVTDRNTESIVVLAVDG